VSDLLRHRVRPPAAEPEGALVLFHGRGADELDLLPLLEVLDPERRLLGVTPRGPLSWSQVVGGTSRFPQTPSTGPLPRTGGDAAGAHWYVVERVGFPDPATFHPTVERAGGWLDALARETGVPPERTVLGGFSQGAVMTYALGLGRGRPRYAGLIALSGFIPVVEGWEADLDRELPPIAIGHGTYDPIIEVGFGRRARETLEAAGAAVTYRESPMPHAIDPRFAAELAPWIGNALRSPAPEAR
jgi:phospholipase/carboxylesterase